MIFVTGGTGLVGSHLLYKLASEGLKVRALCRKSSSKDIVRNLFRFYSDNAEQLLTNIEWFKGDLLDYFSLKDALTDIQQVYHCAAMVSFKPNDAGKMFTNNVEGTANLVNACIDQNITRFCYVSSIATLGGSPNGQPIDESCFWQNDDNHSVYSQSKFSSEMEVWRGIKEGLNAVIVNPSIIIGPVQPEQSTGQLFKTVMDGNKFYTPGTTGFVDVRDVVKVMVKACNSEVSDERFIVNAENLPYKTFMTMAAKALNAKKPKYKAGRILSGLAWRFERLKYYIFRTEPRLTKETARSSQNKSIYSDARLQEKWPIQYIPIEDAIKNTVRYMQINS